MILLLFLLLLRPTAVFLNRGNHEDHYVNCQYGFIKELQKKYKASAGNLSKCFSDLFRFMPLATIIDDKIFVCHGGISPETDLEILETMDRTAYFTLLRSQNKGATSEDEKKQFTTLLWSDPVPQNGARKNEQRGLGCFFGPDVTANLLKKHNFDILIRSHECKTEGYEWTHDNKLLTIFSASNYYAEGSNKGAYVRIESNGAVNPVQFVVSGGKKRKTLSQSVNMAEESALTDLKRKIATHSVELKNEFLAADPENTGQIPLAKWSWIMEKVLDLKLPWRTIQPRLCVMSKEDYMVYYDTTFQRVDVSNSLTEAPTSVTEELYKQRDILEGIFRAMDKDNSGFISLSEFKTACLRLPTRTNLDESSIADLAKSIDFNKDGQIDFNEFLEAFRLAENDLERQG